VTAQSRLQTAEQFGAILLKTTTDGAMVHLRDVARMELGARTTTCGPLQRQCGIRRGDQAGTGRQRARYRQRGESHVEQLSKQFPKA
jgi:multidrug efflux pump